MLLWVSYFTFLFCMINNCSFYNNIIGDNSGILSRIIDTFIEYFFMFLILH